MRTNLFKNVKLFPKSLLIGIGVLAGLGTAQESAAQITYCTPNYTSGCSEDKIEDFIIPLAGFSHTETGCSSGTYGDYSGVSSLYITLSKGISYDYTITSEFDWGKIRIWIDANNDGEFSDSEIISTYTGTYTGTYEYNGVLSIPTSVINGSYRMRVAYRFNTIPTACHSGSGYGEVHDYTVNVVNPPCAFPEYTHAVVDDCDGDAFSVSFNVTNMGDADSLQITGGALTTKVYTIGTYLVGPYSSDDVINFTIAHSGSSFCNSEVNNVKSSCPRPCVSGYRYPSTIVLEPTCSGTTSTLYTGYYAGEYTVVNMSAGVTYTFSTTIASDNLTVSSNDATPIVYEYASGSVSFTPTVNGNYRVYIHKSGSCESESVSRNLLVNCTLPCDYSTASFTTILDCANNQYSVSFDITDMGSASELYLTDGTTITTVSTIGTIIMGPYTSGTTQNFNLINDDDSICTLSFSNITANCPPINDEASGAITINLGDDCAAGLFTNVLATSGSEPLSPVSTTAGLGVWFKFVAPASGAVRITTDSISGTMLDTRVTLFSATDASDYATFSAIGADEDNGANSSYGGVGFGYLSTLYTTSLTPGSTYYVKVEGYNATTSGTFCLRVDELSDYMLSDTYTCSNLTQSPLGSVSTNTREVSLVDNYGKLIAIVRNPLGGSASSYSSRLNINAGAVRTDDNGDAYLNRNIMINNSSATNVDVQLFFLNSELTTLGTSLDELKITKVTGTTCSADLPVSASRVLLTPSATGTVNGVSWLKFNTPNFSNFYISSSSEPLSVQISNIHANNSGAYNTINWKVASAKPENSMILERSKDAQHFTPIYEIADVESKTYTFLDENPILGINFYRIAIQNEDGTKNYSKVVSATVESTNADISIYPNPVDKLLQVKLNRKIDNANIEIIDITGKVVKSINNVQSDQLEINLDDLAQGNYILKYNDGRTQEVFKFTKM